MSIFCEEDGKRVTIIVPLKVARDCTVKIQKCHKQIRDDECNACIAKYACAIFLGETDFSLTMIMKKHKHK